MKVYRDSLGRFAIQEKAISYQIRGEWKSPIRFKEKIEKKQFNEYSYFISVSLETRKDHHFHTEFLIVSPIKLNEYDIKKLLLSKYSSGSQNYANILKQEECEYEMHEEFTMVDNRPSLHIERTESISRK